MPMHQPLVFSAKRSALLNTMVERAYKEAAKRGIFLSANAQEARMILVRRMIAAIEAGATEPELLQALALEEDKPLHALTGNDLFWTQLH